MNLRFLLLIFIQLAGVSATFGKDYQLIEQLPKKLAAAQKEGHKGWDKGSTPVMKEATRRYNDALITMIKELVNAYYPKGFISGEEIERYQKALHAMHSFKQNATNPSGEFQGTLASLELLSSVSDDLEKTICDMVEAIVSDDPKFDYKAWKEKWQKSKAQ